jgi:hypothetical protein
MDLFPVQQTIDILLSVWPWLKVLAKKCRPKSPSEKLSFGIGKDSQSDDKGD